MPASQQGVSPMTPLGANLLGSGATFRVWAPRAKAVHVTGSFGGRDAWQPSEENRLLRDDRGYWAGFMDAARDGDQYKFYVVGEGTSGYKRDPYARELTKIPAYPFCNCIIRDAGAYPWHDGGYRPPAFNDLIIYQLHIGTFAGPNRRQRVGRFLDVLERLDHLKALAVNAVELLPVVEFAPGRSRGFEGTDLFSPEMDYCIDGSEIGPYLGKVNSLLGRYGAPPLSEAQLAVPVNQLKVLIDLLHLSGIAVILNLVHNHVGFQVGGQSESIYFLDRAAGTNPNDSQFFTDQQHIGPIFAFWKQEVRQFLIDNANFFLEEYHADGFRHDRVDVILAHNYPAGLTYCRDMTASARAKAPSAIQIAEHWPAEPWVARGANEGGAGFDAVWHDGLRDAIRAALEAASAGRDVPLNLAWIGEGLDPVGRRGFSAAWRVVQCIENHDQVDSEKGRRVRIPALADGADARSWFACSRARLATGLLLTAPGIPLLFMGQEFLESRPWGDDPDWDPLVGWEALDGGDKVMSDHLRFCQEMVRLRRRHPALRGDRSHVFHINPLDRVLAFHRWLEGNGRDVVVVASLREETLYGYRLGLPRPGRWAEAFNTDIYQNWVNPLAAGNGGQIWADAWPAHGFAYSAALTIPANSLLVFTLDDGDWI